MEAAVDRVTGFEGMSEVIKAAQAMNTIPTRAGEEFESWRGVRLIHIPLRAHRFFIVHVPVD